jgi:predicted membrane channel-forming protein YqfA (hemolysin III family)
LGLRFVVFGFVQGSAAINMSYFITGLMIFLPAIIFTVKTGFLDARNLVLSAIFLFIALFFRYADDWENQLFAAGTHWLWHIFTSAGALTLTLYLIKIKDVMLNYRPKEKVSY